MKSDTSPARLQGASAATQAWIESAPVASATLGSDARAGVEGAVAAERVAGEGKFVAGGGVTFIMGAVGVFNAALKHVKALEAGTLNLGTSSGFKIEKDDVSGDWKLSSEPAMADDQRREDVINEINTTMRNIYDKYSVDIERAVYATNINMKVVGDIVQKNDDGTYRFGVFPVASWDGPVGGVYVEHDGSGFAKRYHQDGTVMQDKLFE